MGITEVALGWMINHLLFVWDAIWGYFEPIIITILMGTFRAVVIASLGIFSIYILVLLFTSSNH